MTRAWMLALLGAVLLAVSPAFAAPPATIAQAVDDPVRPDSDRQADALRKPAEMLAFARVHPGMKVMDLWPGGGYFTRLFAKAVGPTGHVYAYQPAELDSFSKGKPAPIYETAKGYANVSVLHGPLNTLTAPEWLDLVWTSQNYHDMHNSFPVPTDIAKIDKAVFDILKPGGVFIVLDHAAEAGSGVRDTQTLHRIDEAAVKKEVEAAGFRLAGESRVLRNPKDPRTAIVFDPSIRGHTDQFILKFVKPKH
jgi:predicted methyltransferase